MLVWTELQLFLSNVLISRFCHSNFLLFFLPYRYLMCWPVWSAQLSTFCLHLWHFNEVLFSASWMTKLKPWHNEWMSREDIILNCIFFVFYYRVSEWSPTRFYAWLLCLFFKTHFSSFFTMIFTISIKYFLYKHDSLSVIQLYCLIEKLYYKSIVCGHIIVHWMDALE